MSWWDDLSATIGTLLASKQTAQTPATILEGYLDDLVTAIAQRRATVDALFAALDAFFRRDQLGQLLLTRALVSQDATTITEVLIVVSQRRLLTNQALLRFVFTAPDFSLLPDRYRTMVLEALANHVLNLDNLVTAIDGAGLGGVCMPLLASINYREGQPALHSQILKYSSRFPALFPIAIGALIAAGSSAEHLVLWALQFEKRFRERVLPLLLPILIPSGQLNIAETVRLAYESKPFLLTILIPLLFLPGLLPWDAATVALLLGIAQLQYAGNRDAMRDLFTQVFGVLIDLQRNSLDQLMQPTAAWLETALNAQAWSLSSDRPEYARLRNLQVMDICTPIWLVGSCLQSLLGRKAARPDSTVSLVVALVSALLTLQSTSRDRILEQFLRMPGLALILVPALAIKASTIPMSVFEWFGQDIRQLRQSDRVLAIKELAPPAANRRYMIFSDLHRDSREDTVDPELFDVAHFSKNKDIYLRALRYCQENGYVVIENGDCEELWYAPRMNGFSEAARAEDIFDLHSEVYTVLKELFDDGSDANCRYYRTRGNHDNFWGQGTNITLLQQLFASNLPLWDGIIIPEVKTMASEIFALLLEAARDWDTLDDQAYFERWVSQIPIGLSPDHYTEKKPLFIVHGHQFDFWNCDEHSFLGKAITNGVAVPIDGLDALPYYLKGIDLDGNPILKFWDILGKIAPWDNWPPEDLALALARKIENVSEVSRKLIDSYSFSETFTALAPFLMKHGNTSATIASPAFQILIGHTHYPQSRPHLNLNALLGVGELIDRLVKLPYYNSGTGGWWEGVIWAIEITAAGQPKLVYWDRKSCAPQVMSWELHAAPIPWDRYIAELQEFGRNQLPVLSTTLRAAMRELRALAAATASLRDLEQWLQSVQGQAVVLQLAGLSPARQYQQLNLAVTALLGAVAFGSAAAPASVEITLNMARIPLKQGLPMPLMHATGTLPSLQRFFSEWMGYMQVVSGWSLPDLDTTRMLSGLFFLIANHFDSGVFNQLGLLLLAALETNTFDSSVRYNAQSGELGLRFDIHP